MFEILRIQSDIVTCFDITMSLFCQVCGVLTFSQQCVTLKFHYYSLSSLILDMEIPANGYIMFVSVLLIKYESNEFLSTLWHKQKPIF
jgi:hypothetical protein